MQIKILNDCKILNERGKSRKVLAGQVIEDMPDVYLQGLVDSGLAEVIEIKETPHTKTVMIPESEKPVKSPDTEPGDDPSSDTPPAAEIAGGKTRKPKKS